MSKYSTRRLVVKAMLAVCILFGISRAEEKPEAGSLAHFRFNGDATDAQKVNADFELQNTEFKDDAVYLNGLYDLSVEKGGYRAVCKTSGLEIERFTVAMRFKSEPHRLFHGEKNILDTTNLFTGGVSSYRWFGLERTHNGNLVVWLNNGMYRKEIKGAFLEHEKWTVVACSVDIPARKVIAGVKGKKVTVIDLPKDFEFLYFPTEIQGVEIPKEVLDRFATWKREMMNKDTEKAWSFSNYSNGGVFHGLVDELIIYGRALNADELEKIPLWP